MGRVAKEKREKKKKKVNKVINIFSVGTRFNTERLGQKLVYNSLQSLSIVLINDST